MEAEPVGTQKPTVVISTLIHDEHEMEGMLNGRGTCSSLAICTTCSDRLHASRLAKVVGRAKETSREQNGP